jgi:endonuclease VIII
VPEGDTIAWAAHRLRPVLVGHVPDEIRAPRNPDWGSRLAGRAVEAIDTHGKHLFIRLDGSLVVHSHLGMVGSWAVLSHDRIGRRAWLVMHVREVWVAQFDGPTLELLSAGRVRFDQRLAALGPDVLAPSFDVDRYLMRLREDDPTRALGDALLDQRNLAGIGNIWKAEGCWEAGLDPWRALRDVSNDEAAAFVAAVRPRMLLSAQEGPRTIQPRVYKKPGQPCPRCGTPITARGQGDDNRTTYWCPGCQR